MAGMVLLRHDTPDGGSHFDWMIQRGDSLITFRVTDRIDRGCTAFGAIPLPDHRVEYLRYEGPVSGGRGGVTRIAEGAVETLRDGPGLLQVQGRLGTAAGTFEGRPAGSGLWRFRFTPEKLGEGG
jgi:hypothetical protein